MTSKAVATTCSSSSEAEASWNSQLLLSILVLVLVLASVPVRNAQYVLPWVVAVHVALAGRPILLNRLLGLTLLLAASSIVVGSVSLDRFNPSGALWAAITYGTLMFWPAWPRAEFVPVDFSQLRKRACDWVAVFVIVQSSIGLGQFLLSRQPDRADSVTGTLAPVQFLTGGTTISQPSLAVLLIGALLFVAALGERRLHRASLLLGVICVLVSQSGHQVILVVVAAVLVLIAAEFSIRSLTLVAVGLLVLFGAGQLLTPATIDRAPVWFERIVLSEDSPKRQVWSDALSVVTNDALPGLGVGAGQFSSRAGLIASGDYLSVRLPGSLTGRSELYIERVEPRLATFELVGEGSAISKPYSSATTLLVELGPLVSMAVIVIAVSAVIRHLVRYRVASEEERRIRLALAVGIVFLSAISFVENYVELAQAAFLPTVLYFIGATMADTLERVERSAQA